MSDEYFNHDGVGSGFFGLILLLVFLLGGFVVARVHEPGQDIGAVVAKARLAKREKIQAGASEKLAGYSVVSKEKRVVSLPIDSIGQGGQVGQRGNPRRTARAQHRQGWQICGSQAGGCLGRQPG